MNVTLKKDLLHDLRTCLKLYVTKYDAWDDEQYCIHLHQLVKLRFRACIFNMEHTILLTVCCMSLFGIYNLTRLVDDVDTTIVNDVVTSLAETTL